MDEVAQTGNRLIVLIEETLVGGAVRGEVLEDGQAVGAVRIDHARDAGGVVGCIRLKLTGAERLKVALALLEEIDDGVFFTPKSLVKMIVNIQVKNLNTIFIECILEYEVLLHSVAEEVCKVQHNQYKVGRKNTWNGNVPDNLHPGCTVYPGRFIHFLINSGDSSQIHDCGPSSIFPGQPQPHQPGCIHTHTHCQTF